MDRAVVDQLRRASPTLRNAAIIERLEVNEQLDLVLAIGWPRKVYVVASGEYPWSSQDRIGLFLQDKTNAGRVFQLAVEPGPNDDCSTRIERMTAQDLVLSCVGEKWSTYDNQKFLYDIRAKALVKHFSYAPFWTARVVPTRVGPKFVMSDSHRVLLVEVDSGTGVPRVVPDSEAHSVLAMVPMEESTAGTQTFRTPAPSADPAAEFGPGKRFRLTQEKNKYGSGFPVIIERRGQQEKPFPLPQSGLNTWREARPEDLRRGLVPDPAEMNEQIGPHQLEGGRLWFGKTFYNGEGLTGVGGGFGYFDGATRSYQIYSSAEIRRWSVSALLVEPDFIWLALYGRGEYGNTPGGLLRWDRRTKQVQVFDPQLTIMYIARCGDALSMGTNGVVVLKEYQLRSYFVDQTSDGRYRMAARKNAPKRTDFREAITP